MEGLKTCIRSYRDVDNKLRDLNKRIYELREERRSLEVELGEIVRQPQFDQIQELRINEDNSSIKIQRPGWKKPWSISKKDVGEHISSYFQRNANPNQADCTAYVLEEQSKKLVSEEFSFSRVVRED
jgi:hypothetical protein